MQAITTKKIARSRYTSLLIYTLLTLTITGCSLHAPTSHFGANGNTGVNRSTASTWNNEPIVCRKMPIEGTRIKRTVCLSLNEIRTRTEDTKTLVEAMRETSRTQSVSF